MISKIFIDTWGWVAMGRKSEPEHQEVIQLYSNIIKSNSFIFTSDYVLDEVVTLIFGREPVSTALNFVEGILFDIDSDIVQLERVDSERFDKTWSLKKKYMDKPRISFTDLSSMVIMKELDIQDIMTDDDHFLHVGMGFRQIP